MFPPQSAGPRNAPPVRARTLLRALLACALGVAAAFLISCGGPGAGLIPASSAGPLQTDFEEVATAAQSGNGNCSATEAALAKTEQDFRALPSTIDSGLRNTLHQGIANLHARALSLCAQPTAGTTSTATTTKTTPTNTVTTPTPTTTTPTDTTSTPTATAPSPTTTTTTPGSGGGTIAPGAEPPPAGGGTGAGEKEAGGGAGAPGQEGGGK